MNRGFVNRCLRWMMNELFPFYDKNSLPEDLKQKVDAFYKSIEGSIDWHNMSRKDLLRLGFISLEEDEEDIDKSLWFIPNWLFPCIPDGMTVYDRDYKPFVFRKGSASREVMYGCLTFGIFEEQGGTSDDCGTGIEGN